MAPTKPQANSSNSQHTDTHSSSPSSPLHFGDSEKCLEHKTPGLGKEEAGETGNDQTLARFRSSTARVGRV